MGETHRPDGVSRRRILIAVVVALPVLGVGGGLIWRSWGAAEHSDTAATIGGGVRRETRPTLDPARFTGKPAQAFRVAREIPDVIDQIHCYCGCDREAGHVSLLSCYVDGHAVT
jgi:uncharacterized protein with PCYCGC motif